MPLSEINLAQILASIAIKWGIDKVVNVSQLAFKLSKNANCLRGAFNYALNDMGKKHPGIDKKRMRLKDAGLPQAVMDKTPKLLRMSKLPIVKGKVGPQIMSFICDDKIFDRVPVKKEVKAGVSGIYITDVKGLHGKIAVEEKKKGFFAGLVSKIQEKAGAKPVK